MIYLCCITTFVGFLIALNARGRVRKIENSCKDLDWDSIANLTGDIATVKKTIQTLNNRMSGMNSPKLAEEQLIQQFYEQQQPKTNGRVVGG